LQILLSADNFSRKIYHTDFNEISYNHKDLVQNTLSKKINDDESIDEDEEDSDTDISKDSFYYVTTEDDSD